MVYLINVLVLCQHYIIVHSLFYGVVYTMTLAWATQNHDWMIRNLYHGRDCSHPIVVPGCPGNKSNSVHQAIESIVCNDVMLT